MQSFFRLICVLVSAAVLFSSCEQQQPPAPSTTNTGSSSVQDSLTGTTWELYLYKNTSMQNPLPRTDTLIFTSATAYTWNGIPSSYSLVKRTNYNDYYFSLDNTSFGNLNAVNIPLSFKVNGELISVPFGQVMTGGQTFYIWMKEI